jgi:hypothetical protein
MKQTASRVVLIHALNDSSSQQLITAHSTAHSRTQHIRWSLAHEVESSYSQRSQPHNVGLA